MVMENLLRALTFIIVAVFVTTVFSGMVPVVAAEIPSSWSREWPQTNFSKTSIKFNEVLSGGPPKDGIASIDKPQFVPVSEVTDLGGTEPVIVLTVKGQTKLYPLRILIWHEIVNDEIAGQPVTVTYCPLCNAAIVFDARLKGQNLTFGTTGKLRKSDLIMYDRQTESWWQQFSGQAIVGQLTGQELKMLPTRIEAFGRVVKAFPKAHVLVPSNPSQRRYGENPYRGYDTAKRPFLYDGELPDDVPPMMRVVVVDGRAWTLALLRKRGRIEWHDLVLAWQAGQNSVLDSRQISKGRDVGNVKVQRQTQKGLIDVVHHATFAFVFHAFHPDGILVK